MVWNWSSTIGVIIVGCCFAFIGVWVHLDDADQSDVGVQERDDMRSSLQEMLDERQASLENTREYVERIKSRVEGMRSKAFDKGLALRVLDEATKALDITAEECMGMARMAKENARAAAVTAEVDLYFNEVEALLLEVECLEQAAEYGAAMVSRGSTDYRAFGCREDLLVWRANHDRFENAGRLHTYREEAAARHHNIIYWTHTFLSVQEMMGLPE